MQSRTVKYYTASPFAMAVCQRWDGMDFASKATAMKKHSPSTQYPLSLPPLCRFAPEGPSRSSSSSPMQCGLPPDIGRLLCFRQACALLIVDFRSPVRLDHLPLDLSTPQPPRLSPSPIFGHPSSSHFQSLSTPLLPANLSMPQPPDLCLPLLPFSVLCFSPKIPVRRSPSLPLKSLFVDLPPFPQNFSPSLSITLAHFVRYVVNHCLHLSRSLSPPACRPRLLELPAWINRTARPRLLELSAWIGKTARPRLVALACSNCRPRLARAVCLD